MNNIKYVSGVTVYNVNVEDDIIYIDTSASPVTVVLPNIQNSQITLIENKTFTISDFTNNAANNNISIVANGNTVNSNQLTAINSNNGSAFATIVGVSSWQVVTDNPITNGLTYMGTWNANTNTPTLVSSVGIGGQYYIVSVSGTTNLNGVTDWNVGDWAVFIDGTTNVWQKVDNHEIQSYNFIQNKGVALPQQTTLDFEGLGFQITNGVNKTVVTLLQGLPATAYGLYSQTSDSTPITATTTESSLIGSGIGGLSVPANGFFVGASFVANLGGLMSAKNGDTLTIKVKSGSIVLADSGAQVMPAITDSAWRLSINFTIRQLGAAGVASIVSSGIFNNIRKSNNALEGFSFNSINSTTFDTTILNTLDITAQWSSTSSSNSIHSDIFNLNKVY